MIQLYTKATVQSGGTARSVQRDLILLVNRPSSWRSPIFFHWSDRGIVRVFFCYSAVLRVVRAPPLPSSMVIHAADRTSKEGAFRSYSLFIGLFETTASALDSAWGSVLSSEALSSYTKPRNNCQNKRGPS